MACDDSGVRGIPVVAVGGLPGEALSRAVSLLRETVPGAMDTLRLGGGTAVAALWHHRTSTDIDLACGETTFEVLRAEGSPLLAALLRLRSEGRIPRPTFGAGMIGWEYPGTGEVSIVRRFGTGEELLSGETDDLTGVPLVAPSRILHAKLAGRVAGSGKLLARDGYDLACAYHYDPDAIAWATEQLDEGQRNTVERMMGCVLASSRRIIEGRPLMDYRHRQVARDPWLAFASMFLGRPGVDELFPKRG